MSQVSGKGLDDNKLIYNSAAFMCLINLEVTLPIPFILILYLLAIALRSHTSQRLFLLLSNVISEKINIGNIRGF